MTTVNFSNPSKNKQNKSIFEYYKMDSVKNPFLKILEVKCDALNASLLQFLKIKNDETKDETTNFFYNTIKKVIPQDLK